jgi:hypothetical protein
MNGQAVQRVREALEEHGCQPRGSHERLRAQCLVHGSRGLTLAISQGRRGAVLHCHAGCEVDEILAALGLTRSDLFDGPLEASPQAWNPAVRPPGPAGAFGKVIARTVEIAMTADAMRATAVLRPRLSADERVALAEWGSQQDADRHYWQVLARWAALAGDEVFIRQAYKDRVAGKATYEQHQVLRTRAEDLERVR